MKSSPTAWRCHHHLQWTMSLLRCRKCQICTFDFEFGINKLYLSHIWPYILSHIAARSPLVFVPLGSVREMAFLCPPSLIGQCYSKLSMCSGSFDVLITPDNNTAHCRHLDIILLATRSKNITILFDFLREMLFIFIFSSLNNEPLSVWFLHRNMVVILIIHRKGKCKAAVSSLGPFIFHIYVCVCVAAVTLEFNILSFCFF